MTVSVSLKELIESGAHFGHQTRRWNPKMEEFLYGSREGVHIFDLTKTKERLEEALNVLKENAKKGNTILLVGTKKQAKEKVKEIAKNTGCFYITERWLGGILSNFEQVRRSATKLVDMKEKKAKGIYSDRTKKERVLIDREIERLERFFSGIIGMNKAPDVIVVVDVRREFGAVREARNLGVTTIGIVDSNSDPTVVNYPVPMNDDASHAVEYVLELMQDSIFEGKGIKKEKKATEVKSEKVIKEEAEDLDDSTIKSVKSTKVTKKVAKPVKEKVTKKTTTKSAKKVSTKSSAKKTQKK